MYDNEYHKTITKCKLDNGKIVLYDGCSSTKNTEFYDPKHWKYIGRGTIYSVDGYPQSGTDKYYFFKLL